MCRMALGFVDVDLDVVVDESDPVTQSAE